MFLLKCFSSFYPCRQVSKNSKFKTTHICFPYSQGMGSVLQLVEIPSHYELQLKVATDVTLLGVNFSPSAYVGKANSTRLPFLKIHFLSQCEEGLLFFTDHLEFHYR